MSRASNVYILSCCIHLVECFFCPSPPDGLRRTHHLVPLTSVSLSTSFPGQSLPTHTSSLPSFTSKFSSIPSQFFSHFSLSLWFPNECFVHGMHILYFFIKKTFRYVPLLTTTLHFDPFPLGYCCPTSPDPAQSF